MNERVICTNKKLFRDYEILDTIECGVELKGSEVKSLRDGKASIDDAFGRIDESQIYLHNCYIPPYEKASYFKEEATRVRRLLLHKAQIRKLIGQVAQRGFTLVPMRMYFNTRGLVKVALSLARGKKFFDRREDIKKRDVERETRRAARARQKR